MASPSVRSNEQQHILNSTHARRVNIVNMLSTVLEVASLLVTSTAPEVINSFSRIEPQAVIHWCIRLRVTLQDISPFSTRAIALDENIRLFVWQVVSSLDPAEVLAVTRVGFVLGHEWSFLNWSIAANLIRQDLDNQLQRASNSMLEAAQDLQEFFTAPWKHSPQFNISDVSSSSD